MRACVCASVHTSTYVCKYVCVQVRMCASTYVCEYVCVHVYMLIKCLNFFVCRGRGADSDSDSSSMLFDSDVDFDLTVEIPEQANTKVYTPSTALLFAASPCCNPSYAVL